MSDMQQPPFCVSIGKAGSGIWKSGGGRRMRSKSWVEAWIVGLLILHTSFLYEPNAVSATTLKMWKDDSMDIEKAFEKAWQSMEKKVEMGYDGSVKWKKAAFHNLEETVMSSGSSEKISKWLGVEADAGEATLFKDVGHNYDMYCFVKHGRTDSCRPVMERLLKKFGTTWQVLVVMEEGETGGGAESGCIIVCIVSMSEFDKNPMEVNALLHPLLQTSSIPNGHELIAEAFKKFVGDTVEVKGEKQAVTIYKTASFMDGKLGSDMKNEICEEVKSKLDAYVEEKKNDGEMSTSYHFEGHKYETHILVKRALVPKDNCTQIFESLQRMCERGSQVAVVLNLFCSVAYFTSMNDFVENPILVNTLIHNVLRFRRGEKMEKKRSNLFEKALRAAYPRPSSPTTQVEMHKVDTGSVTGKKAGYLAGEAPGQLEANQMCDLLKSDLRVNQHHEDGQLYYQSAGMHYMYMLVKPGVGQDTCQDAINLVTESCGEVQVFSLLAKGCRVSYIMSKHHGRYGTRALDQFALALEAPKGTGDVAFTKALEALHGETSQVANTKLTRVALSVDSSRQGLVAEYTGGIYNLWGNIYHT